MPRTLDEIRADFLALHVDVATLSRDALRLEPSLRLVVSRGPVRAFASRADKYLERFTEIDADLMQHANPPMDINAALRHSARFQSYMALRESVRTLIADTNQSIGSIRSELDFRGSLMIAIVALVVSIISMFVDVSGLFG